MLNEKYGLDYKSIDDLDSQVKDLLQKGVSLSRAYVAVHYDELSNRQSQDPAQLAKSQLGQSTKHLSAIPGGNAAAPTSATVTQSDVDNVRRFMPNATQEQIVKFLSAHPEYKIK